LRSTPEPPSLRAHLLQDVSLLAFLALILVPFYLLMNQYWKSLILLVSLYGMLGLAFFRLGRHMRRVMRRVPAEIPPWQAIARRSSTSRQSEIQFGAAEAIQQVYKDPHYLQDVLKPHLRQILFYRTHGHLDISAETPDVFQLADSAPIVVDFLQRREDTGLWSRYRRRQQRVQDTLTILRHLETL
jgi:hypothetical protein